MDASRLRSVAESLLKDEDQLGLTAKLQVIVTGLANMSSQPGQPAYQTQLSQALQELEATRARLRVNDDPVFAEYVDAIAAKPYFTGDMIEAVRQSISSNGMTPATAQQQMQKLLTDRTQYVTSLKALVDALKIVKVETESVRPGEAEVGFRIPRELFKNELDGWIGELRQIDRVVRAFSELATGSVAPIEVGELSSTNPLIFLLLAPSTAGAIAKAVSWSLEQWKKVEDIREVRNRTAKASSGFGGSFDDLVADFDKRIQAGIEQAISQHAESLVQPRREAGREHEQVNDIAFGLRYLVSRIERGMTVELRFLPPPPNSTDAVDQEAFNSLAAVAPTLSFPAPSTEPLIELMGPNSVNTPQS